MVWDFGSWNNWREGVPVSKALKSDLVSILLYQKSAAKLFDELQKQEFRWPVTRGDIGRVTWNHIFGDLYGISSASLDVSTNHAIIRYVNTDPREVGFQWVINNAPAQKIRLTEEDFRQVCNVRVIGRLAALLLTTGKVKVYGVDGNLVDEFEAQTFLDTADLGIIKS